MIEPKIHQAFQANPGMGHDVQHNVPWPPGPDATVLITTDIYDDPPGPGFSWGITVNVVDATHIQMIMPGHFRVQGLATPNYINTDYDCDRCSHC